MLRWDWKECIGYVITKEERDGQVIEFKHYLYNGNAMLIQIWEEDHECSTGKYMVTNFLCDKDHFKNCLKDRNGDWLFEDLVKIVFTEVPTKDQWLWIQEAVRRGKELQILARPF